MRHTEMKKLLYLFKLLKIPHWEMSQYPIHYILKKWPIKLLCSLIGQEGSTDENDKNDGITLLLPQISDSVQKIKPAHKLLLLKIFS